MYCVHGCVSVYTDAAARLKQLELENSPVLSTPRNNINVNVAMNNQVCGRTQQWVVFMMLNILT